MRTILSLLLLCSMMSNCGTNTQQNNNEPFQEVKKSDTTNVAELLEAQPISELNEPTTSEAENEIISKPKQSISIDSLEATPCNIQVILYAHQNIDSMSTKSLDLFLKVFSNECSSNVEFTEFSQEMIFEVFDNYTKEVAELITMNNYDLKAITSELGTPLLDPNVETIISNFRETGIKNPKIDSVIAALERGNQYLNHGN